MRSYSEQARELLLELGLIDLHIDSFIPTRLFGYDLDVSHAHPRNPNVFFGQLDFPRALEQGMTAGMFSITTNPIGTPAYRWEVFQKNLRNLKTLIEGSQHPVGWATTYSEMKEVNEMGKLACLPAIQGGNSIEGAPELALSIEDNAITRITLVHLTSSGFGETSSPFRFISSTRGLTRRGMELVETMNQARVFVDLAHISKQCFWDAVSVHDRRQPLIVTHTGVEECTPHWRNLDDHQCRIVAETGGVIGIMFERSFVDSGNGETLAVDVVRHMEHVRKVAGEDAVAIGTDYDGAITPPTDLREDGYVELVARMLQRAWSRDQIAKALRLNFERTFKELRP
ncbi:MAG: membrane dipeptidase [Myxococcota bacterium]|nr:membrane dipeptidase [Myxococcota bacterium]MEC8633328.1 membrane dipeptidase [Pseudomonadota bacterium]